MLGGLIYWIKPVAHDYIILCLKLLLFWIKKENVNDENIKINCVLSKGILEWLILLNRSKNKHFCVEIWSPAMVNKAWHHNS